MYMYFKDAIYKKTCHSMKNANNECIYTKQLNEYMIIVR